MQMCALEDFYLGRSRPVNLELQQIMVQLDFIEQTGHGVPLIVSKYGRNVFDITENFITVTLPLNTSSKPQTTEITDISLTNTQKEIIKLITKNNTITIAELAKKIKVAYLIRLVSRENVGVYVVGHSFFIVRALKLLTVSVVLCS